MKNYRLIEAVYSKSDPIDLVDPSIRIHEAAMDFYLSDYEIHELDQYTSVMCEGDLLLEWSLKEFIMDNLANLFQFIIGAGVEFGLAATGFGAPIAPFAEMANDVIFMAMSAGDFISGIKTFFSTGVGKLKQAFKELMAIDVSVAPAEIYERIKEAIQNFGGLFEKIGIPVEAALEQMRDFLRGLVKSMAKAVGDLAGVFSPIPGTDALVQNAIVATVDNLYSILAKIVDKMPDWMKEYFYNPGKLKDQIVGFCQNGIDMIQKIKVSDNDKGVLGKIWDTAKDVVTGPLGWMKKLLKTDVIADKIMGWLEKAKGFLDPFINMLKKFIPLAWSAGAALTVIVTEDYDLEAIQEEAGELEEEGEEGVDSEEQDEVIDSAISILQGIG